MRDPDREFLKFDSCHLSQQIVRCPEFSKSRLDLYLPGRSSADPDPIRAIFNHATSRAFEPAVCSQAPDQYLSIKKKVHSPCSKSRMTSGCSASKSFPMRTFPL